MNLKNKKVYQRPDLNSFRLAFNRSFGLFNQKNSSMLCIGVKLRVLLVIPASEARRESSSKKIPDKPE
jgi:hypothetical protein